MGRIWAADPIFPCRRQELPESATRAPQVGDLTLPSRRLVQSVPATLPGHGAEEAASRHVFRAPGKDIPQKIRYFAAHTITQYHKPMENRKWKDYLLLSLKGMGMGAADVVPGVSGGTIAFIVGIYDELIDSIKSINMKSLKLLFTLRLREFWTAVNGNFLFFLLLGIGISVFSLAKVITWLLTEQPILVWAFFFGLVLASTWFVGKDIKGWNWKTVLSFIVGTVVAFYITIATPAETSTHPLFIFLCGAIAICAMILPGISGSFILVLLGKYFYIMDAVKNLDITTLCIFGAGIVIGITSFSHVLSYALKHFRNITLAMLTGFMLGSLNKVWPWKEIVDNTHGAPIETNIAPNEHVLEAVALMLVGYFLVYFLEKLSGKKAQK